MEKEIKAKKNSAIEKAKEKIKAKKKPVFRGRFGNRKLRRKTNEKWDKWRKPRGMDIKRHKQDGYAPDSGYRTPREIRHMHPSGMREIIVSNTKEISNIPAGFAARIASTVGKKKRAEMIKIAREKGVKVLNG